MDSTYLDPMTIDLSAPSSSGVLCVRMAGDVDLAGHKELTLVGPQVLATGARTVVFDVGAVTFFGSTLVNFLVRLLTVVPESRIVLCRPTPMARRVVGVLPLPPRISVRPDLPGDWVDPPAPRRSVENAPRVAS